MSIENHKRFQVIIFCLTMSVNERTIIAATEGEDVMTEGERHQRILSTLEDRPFVTVRDLTDVLKVSPATIRRDIDKLHEAGAARKVFGGIATLAQTLRTSALPFAESSDLAVDAKRAIAAAAVTLCRNGDAIIVSGGSTCHQFGLLLADRPISLFTNSMPLATALGTRGACHLTMTGGVLYRDPGIMHSSRTDLPDFFASRMFLGAQGLGLDGVLESNPLLLEATRPLLDRADEVIVLADSRKLSVRARYLTCPIERISTLITDEGLTDEDRCRFEDAGVRVLVARVDWKS
jgi:DeoR family transcriptional regulator, ulaG and ulaABCDEF operon transcriptional repressor